MKKLFELNEEKAIELGQYLKNKREKLGYSTNYLEIHTNINKADISRIENGKKRKINPIYLKELAKALKLDQIELFNKAGFIDDVYLNKSKTLLKDPRVKDLKGREKLQYEELLNQNALFFNDESISEEDKKKMVDALTEAFYAIKKSNKKKIK